MSTKRTRHSKRGWDQEGDELVNVRGDRIRKVLEVLGLTVTDLANAAGDSQQTISLITRDVSKRTRAARLAKIAAFLGVPTEWLTGETDHLTALEAMLREPPAAGEIPAEWQLALVRWDIATRSALDRDVRRSKGGVTEEERLRREALLTTLLQLRVWRDALFPGVETTTDDRINDPRVLVGAVDFFLALLDPWIRGRADVNYKFLARAFSESLARRVMRDIEELGLVEKKPRAQTANEEGDTPDGQTGDGR